MRPSLCTWAPALLRHVSARTVRPLSPVATSQARACTPSKIRTPRLRAPLASAMVRSVGLALPSPGSHTAPLRSAVSMIG